jgi:hypothetical protein
MCYPAVIKSRTLMGHAEGHTLKSQDHHEELRALPLNPMESDFSRSRGKIGVILAIFTTNCQVQKLKRKDRHPSEDEMTSYHRFRFTGPYMTMPFCLAALYPREPIGTPFVATNTVMDDEETAGIVVLFHRGQSRVVRTPEGLLPRALEEVALRYV